MWWWKIKHVKGWVGVKFDVSVVWVVGRSVGSWGNGIIGGEVESDVGDKFDEGIEL